MNSETELHRKKRLKDFCHVDENNDGDRFVGLKSMGDENGFQNVMVYFPCGYNLPESDVDIRSDIRRLFAILAEFSKGEDILLKVKSNVANVSVNFPIKAYLDIIDYYFESRGNFFAEKEVTYKTDTRGKTDWAKTVEKMRPIIKDGVPIYLKKIVRDDAPMQNQLITEIHKYCTHEAFLKLGWLFNSMVPENTHIRVNIENFKNIIRKQLNKTFEDKYKKLFNAMLRMLDYKNTENDKNQYYFGTDKFEHIWEKMIDRVFGIQEKKDDYFPRAVWKTRFGKGNKTTHALEPDSIMIWDNQIYVLDAKYYRYGLFGDADPSHLPDSSSINKQITYGEYIHKKKDIDPYNAFIMPYNKAKNDFGINNDIDYIGEAYGIWKSGVDGEKSDKKFAKIQGILIDTKFLMNHYLSNSHDKYIKELAGMIETSYEENNGVHN